MIPFETRWLVPGEEALVERAGHLFDERPRHEWSARFLLQPGHHLGIAFVGEEPAGFVTGVEMTHPDKGTEMFLYELAVDEAFRGRGIGTALVRALADRARELGCMGMWVLTDRDNLAAMATYRAAGATEESDHVMLGWDLRSSG
jgi:ribosomal protein S18 acetylase RimI-like enzyme